jgi:hypothetical protein
MAVIGPSLVMSQMGDNLLPGVIVLAVGGLLVHAIRRDRQHGHGSGPQRWIVVVAFLSGPALTGAACLYDLATSREYLYPRYVEQVIVPIMAIGVFSGAIGAVAFWIAELLFAKKDAAPQAVAGTQATVCPSGEQAGQAESESQASATPSRLPQYPSNE